MGSMAASGGYWITGIGRPILAEVGTITGSIGVFALKLQMGTLLRRIGIQFEEITLDESAVHFAVLHLGDQNLLGGVQQEMTADHYKELRDAVMNAFERAAILPMSWP